MSNKTGIEWTDRSANPLRYRDADGNDVWACVKVSRGCASCYSEAMALRFNKGKAYTAANMRDLTPYVSERVLKELMSPKKTPAGSKVFIGDMTDLFGEWVTDDMLDVIFAAFAMRPDVTFQVLTKRPDRMARYMNIPATHLMVTRCMVNFRDHTEPVGPWPLPNVWCGTSVEDQQTADFRIPHLLRVPAKVRFHAQEPLIGPVNLNEGSWFFPFGKHSPIHWCITGGESGDGFRDCDPKWQADIVEQCKGAGVAVFVKQDSGRLPGKQGRIPLAVWQHKEFPEVTQ